MRFLKEWLLYESKEDIQKFVDYFGKELVDRFYGVQKRLQLQDNRFGDLYWWMKQGSPEKLKIELDMLDETPSRTQQIKDAKKGAELLYNKDNWKVYKINNSDASCYYGKDTEWCISADNGYIDDAKTFWNDYMKDGYSIYFFIHRDNYDEKFALQYKNDNTYFIYDENDRLRPFIEGAPNVSGLPNLSTKISPWFMKKLHNLYNIDENDIVSLEFGDDDVITAIDTHSHWNDGVWQTAWELKLKNGDIKYFYLYDQDEFKDITQWVMKIKTEDVQESLKEDLELSNEYDSEENQLTKAQAEFFKDSKIRDSKGRLLVCYHGSPTIGIDTFRTPVIFSDSQQLGDAFTYGEENGLYKCYINTSNIVILDVNGAPFNDLEIDNKKHLHINDVIDNYKDKCDCLIIKNIKEYNRYIVTDYVVFNPNQIKSITNKEPSNSNNINESVYDKDGEYNPSQDSRYKRLLRTPINKLTRDDIKYLFTIHFTRFNGGYNSNGTEHTYWYLGYHNNDFDTALEDSERDHGEEFDKTYEHFSKLNFPLKVYRALRDDEDAPQGKLSMSWTTDINLYKNERSQFKNCTKIVEAEITADMIQNEYTIVNYVLYSANPSRRYNLYPESEITLKPRYKTSSLNNLHFIDKCDID